MSLIKPRFLPRLGNETFQDFDHTLGVENFLSIAILAKNLQTSKTDIIEKAVMQFATSRAGRRNALMQFTGTLAADEADAMLNTIQADKSSKDIDLAL